MKTRLSESDAEAEEPTNHKARNRTLWLVYFSASLATLTMQFSLDHKRRSHERDRCSASDSIGLIFTRSYRFTVLIMTPTSENQPLKLSVEDKQGRTRIGQINHWFRLNRWCFEQASFISVIELPVDPFVGPPLPLTVDPVDVDVEKMK